MSNPFFERPIVNSPYEQPHQHWELDESGQPTGNLIERRRRAEFITPIPKPKKRRGSPKQEELVLDEGRGLTTKKQAYDLTSVINEVRSQVDTWRNLPASQWQVTPETARLLQHWRHHEFGGVRPFFCQIEAVETAIWFTEVAPHLASGKRLIENLKTVNAEANPNIERLALKLATGAGKTTVMAMLIAWLCRIDLLREAGRLTEALAWACLECELHPGNVAAETVKEELKRLTRFGGRLPIVGATSPEARMVRWSGLAGMRQLRAELEQGVIAPLLDPDLYRRYKVPLPSGILLYGPPGCGKTFIANKLAEIINFKFFDISPSDLASIYVHGGQKLIKALFEKAATSTPAMIFFDEFDALVPARDGRAGHHYEAEVNELLTQLNECADRRILVVAATNRAEKIDPAVLRPGRFDRHFYVGPPDLEARVELFRLYLAERPAVGINYLNLADNSQNYTPVEIREVVNEAARAALSTRQPIGHDDILRALSARPPSLKSDDLGKRRIGFSN